MNKKRNILIYAIILPVCFMLTLLISNLFTIPKAKAQEINGSYDYSYDLLIDDYSYFFDIANFDYERWYGVISGGSVSVDILFNGVVYNQIQFVNNVDNVGGIEINLINTNNNQFFNIFSWSGGDLTPLYWYREKIPLYNGTNYTISINSLRAIYLNFTNKVSGYYTFYTDLRALDFISYNWADNSTDYSLFGSFVYQNEMNEYLFDSVNISPTGTDIEFYMTKPNGTTGVTEIYDRFQDDYLRYIYLDSQYIDTFLYEWLKINGDFTFSYSGLGYGNTFWDVINAYVNIPITIISSLLDISIFNTGITILVVFATIVAIGLAFKIIRIFNWG